ncbi:MAG: YgiQ family radical SAM protein [bacterium]|nr:YgiQ family radical SAM protein [bacterium]
MNKKTKNFNFLPMTKQEMQLKGWTELDIIIITGDPYIDHHSCGAAVCGRSLEADGFKVGIIAEPDINKNEDFTALGSPRLFFAISSGAVDSMLKNYTANKKPRRTPNARKTSIPDRALIKYTNKIKQNFKNKPIILGGLEASMRRLAHYDYWSTKIRHSILLDSKADLLIYGMGERQLIEIANRLKQGKKITDIRGTCIVKNKINIDNYILLPSFEEISTDKKAYLKAFKLIYENQNPGRSKTLIQPDAKRFLIHNLPQFPYSPKELDFIFELPYQNIWHPTYDQTGGVPGFKDMMQFSLISNIGCPGECSFCSIFCHQSRVVQSRTPESIYLEALKLSKHPDFKGTFTDIGGATANLFLAGCNVWSQGGFCKERHCLLPEKCPNLKLNYPMAITVYQNIKNIPGVKHVFIQSGLRYDLLFGNDESEEYLEYICRNNISGRMKVAPEHTDDKVLKLMNKPKYGVYKQFKKAFRKVSRKLKKPVFLVNYYITSHPGTTLDKAVNMGLHCTSKNIMPEQIQDFIPLPMTLSAAIYYSKTHPLTNEKIYVPETEEERAMQRALVQYKNKNSEKYIRKALQKIKKIYLFKKFIK